MAVSTQKHWAVAAISVLALSWAGWVSMSLIEIDRVQEAVLARLASQDEHRIEFSGKLNHLSGKVNNIPNWVNDKDRWTGNNQKAYAEYVTHYIDLKDKALENRIERLEEYHPPKNGRGK